jgi:hypothetical protein
MILSYAEDATDASADRVRRSTAAHLNREIDRQTDSNIRHYSGAGREAMQERIAQLDNEWDVEHVLEVNASTLALTGLALGIAVDKKWLAVPAVVLSFLLQHGVQGWCPPLPILRRLGIRTRGEIDREKYELKAALDTY